MTQKRPRRKDDPEKVKNWNSRKPEKVKNWNSRKAVRADLMEANQFKKNANYRHSAGRADRGRFYKIENEKALHPLSRVLLINPWVSAIKPILDAHIREIIIQDTKIP